MNILKKYFANKNISQFLFAFVAIMLLTTNPSAAQEFSGVNTFIKGLVDAITGPIGASVSALAVIAIGFSFMTGRMDWTFAVSVMVGIAIVFGGATFVKGLAPS
jgi:type IV secretion system protein VirB2